jgi:hypothetical protein
MVGRKKFTRQHEMILQTAAKYAHMPANQGSGGRAFAATIAIAQAVSV